MESSMSFKSRDMLVARTPKRFRLTAFLFACLALSQGARAANAEENRWRLKERDLPAGNVVINRQPSPWEAYGPYVSVALVLLLAQTMLILELLRQRKKERIIRGHLRESEARLREAQSIAQCGSWEWDIAKNKTYWSDEMYR